jgi:hypothetical protein
MERGGNGYSGTVTFSKQQRMAGTIGQKISPGFTRVPK